jgi:glycosyltransferase involved in cell wall biosynthesis
MREKHRLQDRIQLLGPVRHSDVRSVLTRGSIFLSTSLTESFGIAILEAACAGLYVVATRVGGAPEILPQDMISFADPNEGGTSVYSYHGFALMEATGMYRYHSRHGGSYRNCFRGQA